MIKIGILGSTRGSSMLPIIVAIKSQQLSAEIRVVISNKQEAMILERAAMEGLATQFLDPKQFASKELYDDEVSKILHHYQVDLVVLIGYMRILSSTFVRAWQGKIINVHPSLLPQFAGGMDLAVHQAVCEAGVSESGCTVHVVTEEVDQGEILIQKKCAVLPSDNPSSLKERVQALEGEALIDAIKLFLGSPLTLNP